MRKVYFRADGNSRIGLGHVYRSLALAEMISSEFECYFITRNPLPALRTEIDKLCKSCIEIPESILVTDEAKFLVTEIVNKSDTLVLDGYHFRTDYQLEIKSNGNKLICIDDIHAYHFVADAIINHSGLVKESNYSAENYTKYYLGLDYALVRKPFRDLARSKKSNFNNGSVMICFGGADPMNNTKKAIDLVELDPSVTKCIVIVGAGYKYMTDLKARISQSSLKIEVVSNISAEEMAKIMRLCSRAITPPSSVSYEYLSVGGSLFLEVIADNQKEMYNYFISNRLAFSLDQFANSTKLVANHSVLDGNQSERLLKVFN